MARLAFDLSILRVLLLEDDTFAREFEKTALLELGVANVALAQDTADALDALSRGIGCDLIVADWNMPAFDGAALVTAVHRDHPGLSILMLTNNEGLDQIRAAQDAGVDGCLIKPFSLAKLREAIQLALVSRLTRMTPAQEAEAAIDPALEDVTASIQAAIANGADAKVEDAGPGQLRDASKLAGKVSRQLDDYIASRQMMNAQQLAVVRLHVDCVQAILTGRPELLAHETQNLIVDGLSFAADLASREG